MNCKMISTVLVLSALAVAAFFAAIRVVFRTLDDLDGELSL